MELAPKHRIRGERQDVHQRYDRARRPHPRNVGDGRQRRHGRLPRKTARSSSRRATTRRGTLGRRRRPTTSRCGSSTSPGWRRSRWACPPPCCCRFAAPRRTAPRMRAIVARSVTFAHHLCVGRGHVRGVVDGGRRQRVGGGRRRAGARDHRRLRASGEQTLAPCFRRGP